jgi:hypothetical protein
MSEHEMAGAGHLPPHAIVAVVPYDRHITCILLLTAVMFFLGRYLLKGGNI